MSAVIYTLHFSGETARPYIKERLQKSFPSASANHNVVTGGIVDDDVR